MDFHRQLLETTRGRILALLRRGVATVDQLAQELKLSPNAVRVQLTRMERDGLVRQAGFERRTTRPSRRFELTPTVDQMMSRAYVPLMTHLVDAFSAQRTAEEVERVIREAGRRLAAQYRTAVPSDAALEDRVRAVASLLNEEFGATTRVERANGEFLIRGTGCPLAVVTGKNPAVCLAIETVVAELADASVRECCSRGEPPRCCFEVSESSRAVR